MSLINEIERLLEKGENLSELGVNNWALNRKDALHLLELLEENGTPVLGGDVYQRNQNRIDITHDNWFCEQDESESDSIYNQRSIFFARNYINNYRSNSQGEKLFAIIFDRNLITSSKLYSTPYRR